MSTPARRTPFVLLLIGLILGGMCAMLALNTASAANEVDRHTLAEQDQNIAAQLVQLNNQLRASPAPANLAAAAEQLGMVPQGTPGFLEIGANGHVRVKGKPAPATAPPPPVPPKPPAHKTTKQKKTTQKKTKKQTAPKKSTTKKTAKTKQQKSKKTTQQQKKQQQRTKKQKQHGTGTNQTKHKHGGAT